MQARCLPAEVVEYLPDLPKRLPEIGLAVSRAGALTLAELSCAGVPSILIPLSTAASGHQQKNALVLAQAGAAELMDETESISEGKVRLRSLLQELSHSELRRQQMSRAAHELARPDAAAAIARRLLEIAQ
jgi:UDP-N-acetylglucosamine--N-acetylmuramyl-(pentapeptide) pyrophosphoryl-undecaprenol N-acetylglucosamine transferase